MKILFCGGGSAGHINPAVAIAERVKLRYKNAEFLFIGREGGFENNSVKKAGIRLKTVKIEGLKRKITVANIKKLLLALKATEEAGKILKEFSPDIVIATGGYVSYPVLRAAHKMKIPTVIHESNVYPGLVTRLLSQKCTLVLLNHKETEKYLKKKCKTEVVGNPLRADFSNIKRNTARKALGLRANDIFIVSFGGSGGAKKINDVIISVMRNTVAHTNGVYHTHATGKKYYNKKTSLELEKKSDRCKILPYIDDMPNKLKAADIVICRSGAMTLSELALVGVSAILIPSPNVTNNHQYKNAKLLSDNGACLLIEEKNLSEEMLTKKIEMLIKDSDARKIMSQKITKFATKNAAENTTTKIMNLLSK